MILSDQTTDNFLQKGGKVLKAIRRGYSENRSQIHTPEKNHLKNHQIFQTPIFHSTLKII